MTPDRLTRAQNTAGFPCTIHGDAFVSRTIDSDADFARLDFTLGEVRAGQGAGARNASAGAK